MSSRAVVTPGLKELTKALARITIRQQDRRKVFLRLIAQNADEAKLSGLKLEPATMQVRPIAPLARAGPYRAF